MPILALALSFAGCASMQGPPLAAGDPVAAVTAKMGQPTAVYTEGAGQVLEYATGPFGQRTTMAHIDAGGRLTSVEQVLTSEKFATLKVGATTKDDALRMVGRPSEHSSLPRMQYDVWSYRYKENGVWNSMMHLEFDQAGVLRAMQNGPDRMEEERDFFR